MVTRRSTSRSTPEHAAKASRVTVRTRMLDGKAIGTPTSSASPATAYATSPAPIETSMSRSQLIVEVVLAAHAVGVGVLIVVVDGIGHLEERLHRTRTA